jgi:alpha-ribazole phosphatase/probable phosphoglycerate mutase
VSEVKERYSASYSAWRSAPFTTAPEGGEPFGKVRERSRAAASLIKSGGSMGGTTFVVSHGGVLRAFLAALMEIDDFNLMWRMRLDNCSISVLDMWQSFPSLLALNDTYHIRLEKKLISRMSFPL